MQRQEEDASSANTPYLKCDPPNFLWQPVRGSPAVLTPPAPGGCPRWRASMPSPMGAPTPTMFPAVLPALPATMPAALLRVGNLLVGQGLDSSPDGNRISLNTGCCEHDEGCCAKSHQKTVHGRVLP